MTNRRVVLIALCAWGLLTCGTFLVYELVTFRQSMALNLSTLAHAIAANSTAALAVENAEDAAHMLTAFAADPHVVAAALYDRDGALFASYSNRGGAQQRLPAHPDRDGYRYGWTSLVLEEPVTIEHRRLGTLYLQSDLGAMYQRFTIYGGMLVGVILAGALVAVFLARRLQRHITQPVLALARTAQTVSEQKDFSIRAERFDDDELGPLTDAFNDMLARVDDRDRALRSQNDTLRREVIERKAAEERFRLVIEAAAQAMLVVDSERRITSVNRKGEELFGYLREELIGQPIETLVPEAVRGSHPDHVAGFLDGPSVRPMGVGRDLFAQRKDGALVPVEVGLSPLHLPDGQYTLASVIDVTERKRMDDDLRRSNADLEQYAYIASHDLQEPLRMVASYTDLLAERYAGKIDARADKYIHYITDGAKRMQRLVSDLLAYSRVGSQGTPTKAVSMDAVMKRVLASLGPLIRERGALVAIPAPLPDVMGDDIQLAQLLQNLIGNALKFRGAEPPRVVITAVTYDNRWRVSVQDNGIGIDQRYADRIFQMFQRLHERGVYEGSGIGLAIAKRIVERHGGRIWFESAVGVGTTFFFTLAPATKLPTR